ncbi:MAG: glycosyltransferase family 1 protein, partial [Tissierellia bacterium]|nr:glycosyltransferase family 1 protein [Tissierellia bacterium]
MVGKAIKDSHVINSAFKCSYINLGLSRTIDEIGKNPFKKVVRYLSIYFNVLKHLITNKPNLCYLAITAKGTAFYKDSLIALLAKGFGVRMVYHFHNKGVSTRQHKALDDFLY